jgi:alkylhydroperoxidase family enzyme
MKFHAPGTPAALVGGAGHSTSLWGSTGAVAAGPDGVWADAASAIAMTGARMNASIFCMGGWYRDYA